MWIVYTNAVGDVMTFASWKRSHAVTA
jgi:hypothetical protein